MQQIIFTVSCRACVKFFVQQLHKFVTFVNKLILKPSLQTRENYVSPNTWKALCFCLWISTRLNCNYLFNTFYVPQKLTANDLRISTHTHAHAHARERIKMLLIGFVAFDRLKYEKLWVLSELLHAHIFQKPKTKNRFSPNS